MKARLSQDIKSNRVAEPTTALTTAADTRHATFRDDIIPAETQKAMQEPQRRMCRNRFTFRYDIFFALFQCGIDSIFSRSQQYISVMCINIAIYLIYGIVIVCARRFVYNNNITHKIEMFL